MNLRRILLELFHAALVAVEPSHLVRERLHDETGPSGVIAIGKAAAGMLLGAQQVLGGKIRRSLLIVPRGYETKVLADRIVHAAHPMPDESSLEAGRVLLEMLADETIDRWLFLISGGASALVEVPAPGISLKDIQLANNWLLSSGFDIRQMNAVRTRLSAIKGGKLLKHIHGKYVRLLLISDVPGDDAAVIGSGLLVPPRHATPLPELPAWLGKLLQAPELDLPAGPEPEVIASNNFALAAVYDAVRERGFEGVREQQPRGDAAAAARAFAANMLAGPPGIYLAGGETTVNLPENPEYGGRNQHFALAAAMIIAGRSDCCLLAAGTDGIDGNTEDAGAIVDGGSVQRGADGGVDANEALAGFDSNRFLAASGDLLHTGPTGTNVMDIVIGLKTA